MTFQIWDVTRLQRIHEARSVRDDLVRRFSTSLPAAACPYLPAAVGRRRLRSIPGRHPGRVPGGYLPAPRQPPAGGQRPDIPRSPGNVNKGIATTLAKEPARFFAYNNGIATTASAVTTVRCSRKDAFADWAPATCRSSTARRPQHRLPPCGWTEASRRDGLRSDEALGRGA